MIESVQHLLTNPWTPVTVALGAGYGLRYLQNLISDVLWAAQEQREQQQQRHDTEEIQRILAGLELEPEQVPAYEPPMEQTCLERVITKSPLVPPHYPDMPDWGPAYYLEGPKQTVNKWPESDQAVRVPLRERLRSYWDSTRPRTAEEHATAVYEQIREEAGIRPPYQPRHAAEGYTPQQLKIVLTSTTEIPRVALRALTPAWDEVSAPRPVEVFSG